MNRNVGGKSRPALVLGLVLAVLLAQPLSWAPPILADELEELVKLASNLERMRGHLWAADLNIERGDLKMAKAHSSHPFDELWPLVTSFINEADPRLAEELEAELKALPEVGEADQLAARIWEVDGLLERALAASLHESLRLGFVFNVRVMLELLGSAIEEYGEGVQNGNLIDLAEYQDARGFTERALALYQRIREAIEEEEREEIDGFFRDLTSSMDRMASRATIATIASGIERELREVAGLEEEVKEGPAAIIANIRELMERSVEEYEEGKVEEAEELAIRAYLENYELIESSVKALAPELNEEIEELLRDEFRALIKGGATVERLNELASQINERLAEAEALLAKGEGIAPTRAPAGPGEGVERFVDTQQLLMPWQAATGVLVAIVMVQTILLAKKKK